MSASLRGEIAFSVTFMQSQHISEIMGTDNDYVKTVYLYLNNLYSRWQKPEQTLVYKNKYLECSK